MQSSTGLPLAQNNNTVALAAPLGQQGDGRSTTVDFDQGEDGLHSSPSPQKASCWSWHSIKSVIKSVLKWEGWAHVWNFLLVIGTFAAFHFSQQSNINAFDALEQQKFANQIADRQVAFNEWTAYKAFWDYCNSPNVGFPSMPYCIWANSILGTRCRQTLLHRWSISSAATQ